ncbi:MAG: citramalate synthase [Candidatus Brocadiae bacterium]|nr:citramalate synthase [Candidatus Brocadiia bacterium]
MKQRIAIYDTTLRDGAQAEGVVFSLVDKVAVARRLDDFGVDYIEGGYPLSNPKDAAFFAELAHKPLQHAQLAAFGNTRRANATAAEDVGLRALLESGAPVATLVGKSWDLHVTDVLRIPLEQNLEVIRDSVATLKAHGLTVFYDAEHFFDGYRANPEYATATLHAARDAGAETIILCDTNGGTLPSALRETIRAVRPTLDVALGIHAHDDAGLAVANSLVAVEEGITHVQGTINGIGERCGNADLCAIVPTLALKMGCDVLRPGSVQHVTSVSRYLYQIANLNPPLRQPYVGHNSFAHKGGLHVDAMQKNPLTYEHLDPERVGNERRILISELSGNAAILAKAAKVDERVDRETSRRVLETVQNLESEGYEFEAADASFALVVRGVLGTRKRFFELEGFRTIVIKHDHDEEPSTEAIVKLRVGGESRLTVAEGDGPVHAMDGALRKALEGFFPVLRDVRLVDYKVRIVNPRAGTAAKICVVIESTDGHEVWGTVGVSGNIIEASWQALIDSIEYKLLKEEEAAG